MATVTKYETAKGTRWRVRYYDDDHKERQIRGLSKREADALRAKIENDRHEGRLVNPADARVTVATLADPWLQAQQRTLKPSSYRPLESAWRIHVRDRWGDREVGRIRHTEVRDWIAELTQRRRATTVIRAHGVLASILDAAVQDRRLAANPARDVPLPKKMQGGRPYLTHEQVDALAAHAKHPDLVLFLAYTGLRWGEATALRLRHLDTLRRRVNVEENAVMVGSVLEVGTPKPHRRRSVPYPQFLTLPLAQLCEGKSRDQLVFGDGDHHLLLPNSRDGWFANAVKRAQHDDPSFPRLSPHGLRHTAASLAISSGAHVKVVQRMLGHRSATTTLDTYSDLFDTDLDSVADRLDEARNAAKMRPNTASTA